MMTLARQASALSRIDGMMHRQKAGSTYEVEALHRIIAIDS